MEWNQKNSIYLTLIKCEVFFLAEIQFVFNIEGSYEKLVNTLKGISQSSRLIAITNLVLNKQPESTSILMTVTGKAFYLK